jgi:ribosomal protein S18 acetylase RimI-like enzyme
MTDNGIAIRAAHDADLPAIIKLQHANQLAQGGTLAAELTLDQIEQMMSDMPQIIACRDNDVVGFLMTTSQAVNRRRPIPVIEKMLQAYAYSDDDAYIYGPICVSETERGNGLAQAMFMHLLELEPNRQGVLFIRSDNGPSIKAHRKMGMNQVGEFTLNGGQFQVFAYKSMALPRQG